MSESQPKDPLQTIQDRAADTIPGLAALAHVIGITNVQAVLADARKRTADGHAAMARAAGMEDLVTPTPEADMGNITITGDITMPAPPPPAAREAPRQWPGWAAGALALAALALGGAGGGLLVNMLMSRVTQETTITKKVEPQEFEVRWWIKDGKLEKEIRALEPGK